jgi:hypothetical protein
MQVEFVVTALIGELWALISPRGRQVWVAHNFRIPPRHPDTKRPSCSMAKPHTQSLCAPLIDCNYKSRLVSTITTDARVKHYMDAFSAAQVPFLNGKVSGPREQCV